MQLQKENLVHFKEKSVLLGVLKVQLINQQAVHLRLLKAEGLGSSKHYSVCIS
jgi:hypothetical protein